MRAARGWVDGARRSWPRLALDSTGATIVKHLTDHDLCRQSDAHVRLELSSRAENIPLLRQALTGFAAATGVSAPDLHDISLALTEACNNVSLHAYDGAEGPLEVELHSFTGTLFVRVRDRGVGLTLTEDDGLEFPEHVEGELAGIGLPTIYALATTVRILAPDDGGTAVEMAFATDPHKRLAHWPESAKPFRRFRIAPAQLASAIELDIWPVAIAQEVLPRVLRAAALQAHFSVDRAADVLRVAAPIVTPPHGWAAAGHLQARVVDDRDSLELSVGVMSAEDASSLAAAALRIEPDLQAPIMQAASGGEKLVLRLGRSQ